MRHFIIFALIIVCLAACQTPRPAAEKDFMFGIGDLGRGYNQLQGEYGLKPPVSGFNQARHVSVANQVYHFEGIAFETVFVFDQPGQEGSLLAVENICRLADDGSAEAKLEQLVKRLTLLWGPPQTETRLWRWSAPDFVASLTIPEGESGVSWVLEAHRNISAPMPASQPLSTLGGWDRALWGNTLESLSELYTLGKVERSRLNHKPVALVQHEVSYFKHPFNASFFFDRFTAQASLVGVDLYLLRDGETQQWKQNLERLVRELSQLYGKAKTRQSGPSRVWEWKDSEGSLTLTDASKAERTTWMLSFRPPPGRVAPTPALSAPRSPYDIAGWGGSRFGMSPAQIELLYMGQSPALRRLAGAGYGFEKALQMDDLQFKVLFLFDRSRRPARLVQVVLTHETPTGQSEEQTKEQLKDLLKLLTAWYGAPTQDRINFQSGGKAVWKRPSGSLEIHNLAPINTWVLNFRVK